MIIYNGKKSDITYKGSIISYVKVGNTDVINYNDSERYIVITKSSSGSVNIEFTRGHVSVGAGPGSQNPGAGGVNITYDIIEYSIDGRATWTPVNQGTETVNLQSPINALHIRGKLVSPNSRIKITDDGNTSFIKVSGNANALVDYTATNLGADFYVANKLRRMFSDANVGCNLDFSDLRLPSMNQPIYQEMFKNCLCTNGGVLYPPTILPATTLAENCYANMFYGCTSLASAPELPATTLAKECYYSMFEGCTSLTTAPELPATTLVNGCYHTMFGGCTNLNYIKCLATDINAFSSLVYWVRNVSPTGTFVKNPSMTSWTTGDSGIPNGWTVEDA